MKMVIAETTGEFMLLDPQSGKEIPSDGPTSEPVPLTAFLQDRVDIGQVEILEEIDGEPEPTEEELAEAEREAAEAEAERARQVAEQEANAEARRVELQAEADAAAEADRLAEEQAAEEADRLAQEAKDAEDAAALAAFDHDGDGKPGGSKKRK